MSTLKMLQIFLGVTNSNKVSFEIWSSLILLSFSSFKEDKKFGKILNVREESEKNVQLYLMCQRFDSFLCICRGVPFKNEEQNFQKKTVISLLSKLKAPVTVNKSDLDGDIEIKFNVVYVIKIQFDIREMHTSKLTNCLASIVIIQYHLVRWCKLEIHAIDRSSNLSVGVYTQTITARKCTERIKNDSHRLCHLKQPYV